MALFLRLFDPVEGIPAIEAARPAG